MMRDVGVRSLAPAIAVLSLVVLGAGEDAARSPNAAPARAGDANIPSTDVLELPPIPDVAPRTDLKSALVERAPGPDGPLGAPLVPGQVISPIDLAGALKLAGARDLDI